jgi:hypothetical protein
VRGRFGIGTALMFLAPISLTFAQNAPPTVPSSPDVILAPRSAAALPQYEGSPQHFVCSRGYTVERCYKDVFVIRTILAKYSGAQIGEWTWVLVRSDDWKAIVMPRALDPDSPAFTYAAKRETFIEEALVADVPGRRDELKARWHVRADKLRDLVIAHELGHALCKDRSETAANQQAERLQHGKSPSCEPNPDPKILAEETTLLPGLRGQTGSQLGTSAEEGANAVQRTTPIGENLSGDADGATTGDTGTSVVRETAKRQSMRLEKGKYPKEAAEQHFSCDVSYAAMKCKEEVAILRRVVTRYSTPALGEWTWVLVRSQDWKPILRSRGLDPDSPAFTFLSKRQTYIEESLVAPERERSSELFARWGMPTGTLLNVALTHEMGHGICQDADEEKANRVAVMLRNGKAARCSPANW